MASRSIPTNKKKKVDLDRDMVVSPHGRCKRLEINVKA